MSWKLWLDDQAFDPDTPDRRNPNIDEFITAETSAQAINLIKLFGVPSFIDFDHDLGGEDTAKVVCKYLTDNHYDDPVPDYNIHSANPEGAAWIKSYMESWKKSKGE